MTLVLNQQPSHHFTCNQLNDVTCHEGPTFPVEYPRHPEYSDFNSRLLSFSSWNYESVQSSRSLATLGFYYTGQTDLVRCYSCSIGFKDFISTDDPLTEHARYSPQCPALLQQLVNGSTSSKHSQLDETRYRHTHKQIKLDPSNEQKQCSKSSPARVSQPHYKIYSVRLASYTGWPVNKRQTPEKLAEAGLYYTGREDIVRCFTCDGGLRSWDPLDDPWIEHCKHFPQCSFVKLVKGDDYIALVQRNYDNLIKPNVAGFPKSGVKTYSSPKQNPTPTRPYLSPSEMTVKEQLLEMGFSESLVNRAVLALSHAQSKLSVEAALDEINKLEDQDKGNLGPSTEGSETKITDPVEEYERLQYKLSCKQCRRVQSDVLFLPCQHHCCCRTCAETINSCLICGAYIQHKIKTFS